MIELFSCPNQIKIDKKEVLRYLGYGNNKSNGLDDKYIDDTIEVIQNNIELKSCYEKYNIVNLENNTIDLGFTKIKSESLSKNLKDCKEVYFFTATIGLNVDRIIQKYSKISPSRAIIAQSVGTSAIEAFCDALCEKLSTVEFELNRYLRPRFSPGYGDFDIEFQKTIFSVLDCGRKIGVTLTDKCIMLPSKSVSALVGVSDFDLRCAKSGCEVCAKKDCIYRRK